MRAEDLVDPGTRDADAVARLRATGSVIFGKANTALMCQDAKTSNPLRHHTQLPQPAAHGWRFLGRAGSSSGSPPEPPGHRQPLTGSLRLPAHYCGAYSLRTSYGIVPPEATSPVRPLTTSDMLALSPWPTPRRLFSR